MRLIISAMGFRRRTSRFCLTRAALLCAFSLFVVAATGGKLAASVRAQATKTEKSSPSAQAIDDDEVIRVSTTEVLLPVTVRDAAGRLVTTLERRDFQVWEEGREQPLSDLRLRRVPVDVLLMVDASSSVASNLEDFRRAVEEFAARLAPDDRMSLLKFDDRVELLQDWTTSRVQLRRSLRRVTPGMFTRFHDALYLAAREQFKDARRRHAVVVLTDGIDSGRGHASLEMALGALLEAGASVYCISNTEIERTRKRAQLDTLQSEPLSAQRFNELRIGDLRESLRVLDTSERNLAALTTATGGRLFKPQSFAVLDSVYAEVAEELRHQYALYYMPLDKTRDGKFRRVQVKTSDPSLRLTARIGYFAPRS
ncbi:MAG TPA: VWA domain-containing protein [Pyrinomonadaceae bacterium]|nr:VWA domain-containing protein [Pyrinomonadaceae bacterium]